MTNESRPQDETAPPEAEPSDAQLDELEEAEAETAADDEEQAGPNASDLEAEVADLKDRLLRAVAETENVRRRLEKDKREGADYAITGFARDLLSVADNLARALQAAEQDEVVNKGLLTGVQMTQKELMKAFEKHGIAQVKSVGEPLDPHVHQAMMEVEADDAHPSGTIIQELQPGYTIRDRLLRPAMVSVAK